MIDTVKYIILFLTIATIFSCKIQPGSSRQYADGNENKVYKLVLRPKAGTQFYYDVTNETELQMKVSSRDIDNLSRSHTGVVYTFNRDTAGNLLFDMHYDKVHLYTRNDGVEADLDAAKAPTSDDPTEKALGALLSSHIVATVSPVGVVKSVTGYQEMTDKIMASFSQFGQGAQTVTRGKIEQLLSNSIIRKNMDQLFRIFPDSAVHIGDKWKLSTPQQDLNLTIASLFTLKDIDDGTARLTSEGKLSGDSTSMQLMGYSVTPDLKGTQEGEYEMDTHTGMLLSAEIHAKVEGNIQMMGYDVPLTFEVTVKMKGQKLR
jgi:Family of unknown function (DUF6263)